MIKKKTFPVSPALELAAGLSYMTSRIGQLMNSIKSVDLWYLAMLLLVSFAVLSLLLVLSAVSIRTVLYIAELLGWVVPPVC